MTQKKYPSDLNNKEWSLLEPMLKLSKKRRGPKRKWSFRRVLDAIFYILKTGCQWRYLPYDFPPWQTVYYHFREWKRNGLWFQLHEKLRRATRVKLGRHPDPSAAILDSQSVKVTAEGHRFCGFDGNKKVKGRKRNILVDTQGFLLSLYVTPANRNDRYGAEMCLGGKKHYLPRLEKIWADAGYTSQALSDWCVTQGWQLETVHREDTGFVVLPKRWIVERTFAWLYKQRRLCFDFERTVQSSESLIQTAMLRLMLRRLAA